MRETLEDQINDAQRDFPHRLQELGAARPKSPQNSKSRSESAEEEPTPPPFNLAKSLRKQHLRAKVRETTDRLTTVTTTRLDPEDDARLPNEIGNSVAGAAASGAAGAILGLKEGLSVKRKRDRDPGQTNFESVRQFIEQLPPLPKQLPAPLKRLPPPQSPERE